MTRPVAADVDRCPNCEMEYDRCPCWDFTPPTREKVREEMTRLGPAQPNRRGQRSIRSPKCKRDSGI